MVTSSLLNLQPVSVSTEEIHKQFSAFWVSWRSCWQCCHESWKTWKVMEFDCEKCTACKIL